jgi:endonuclease G
MAYADTVKARQIDRLHDVGERWQTLLQRRAETVRKLRRGGPKTADSPKRVQLYEEREAMKQLAFARAGVSPAFFQERMIGPTLDLDDYPPNEAARIAGVSVGRIVELGDHGEAMDGVATGFLIAPGLIMTNHHVFGAASECGNCGIQFSYEKQNDTVIDGPVFAFEADRFFFTSEPLDCTVVAVAPKSFGDGRLLTEFGTGHLSPALGKILVGQPVSIIQYPDGGPKKYGVRDNEMLVPAEPTELFIQYTTDTEPGSSGSPAFNKDWEVVALHHSGVPEVKDGRILTIDGQTWMKGMSDSDIHWVANEGVRISKICDALIGATVEPRFSDVWSNLIATFQEDFTTIPAMKTAPAEGESTTPTTIPVAGAPRGVSIVVNGNATFNFGGRATPDSDGDVQLAVKPTAKPRTSGVEPTAAEKKLLFDPNYDKRSGYQENFLPVKVPLPDVSIARAGEILQQNGKPLLLEYHHYSLVMNQTRRMQMWSAVNVDYTPSKRRKTRKEFGDETWVADPRVAGALQIDDQDLYDPAKKFDRGHIVRREDTAWGDTPEEEVFANSDSFHWTNCTPQHEQFNRDVGQYQGLWGKLEDHIQAQAKNVGQRMSIFAGPILDATNDIKHNFGGGEISVPIRFWKIVIVTEEAASDAPRLRAYGFVLDQLPVIQKFGLEKFGLGVFTTYQVTVANIAKTAGVTFDTSLIAADAMAGSPNEAVRVTVTSLDDVRL